MIGNVDDKGRELVRVAKLCLDEAINICGNFVPFCNIGVYCMLIQKTHEFNFKFNFSYGY